MLLTWPFYMLFSTRKVSNLFSMRLLLHIWINLYRYQNLSTQLSVASFSLAVQNRPLERNSGLTSEKLQTHAAFPTLHL